MVWSVTKVILTAGIVVAIAAISKRSSFFAALLASLPLVSVLSMVWMSVEGQQNEQLTQFCKDMLVLVPPSLVFFWVFPLLLGLGWPKLFVFLGAIGVTAGVYSIWISFF